MMINPVGSFGTVPCLMATVTIASRVIAAMADTLGVEASTITPETEFESLFAGDSTKAAELVQAIEVAFGGDDDILAGGETIPDEIVQRWRKETVQAAITYLESLG